MPDPSLHDEIVVDFTELLTRLCADDDTGALVDRGHALRQVQDLIKAELTVTRSLLQQKAAGRSTRLPGTDGRSAEVVFPPSTYKLNSNTNVWALRQILHPHFDTLFKQTCKPRKQLRQRLHLLTDEQHTLLLSSLDESENEPQISFPGG